DFDRAAGIIIIYGTALHALEDRASPKPGETLAVLGAAGGTGLAACELGKLMGLKVIACASSDEKLEFAKAHGAELTLNYAREDPRQSGKARAVDRGRQDLLACRPHLSAGANRRGAESARRPQGDGQGDPASLIEAEPSIAVYSTLSRLPSRGLKCGDDESWFH